MSFLELNGLTIPIARGGDEGRDEIGERQRAVDGTYLLSRRTIKRRWKFATTRLKESDAQIVKGIIDGLGYVWPYDTDYYSHKGVWPSESEISTIHSTTAIDGDPVLDHNGVIESKFGAGSIATDHDFPGIDTNLLGADSRDAENAPTGYIAVNGAAISADTTNKWQGTKSLKVDTDAAGSDKEGAYASASYAPSVGWYFTGSAYVKGAVGGEVIEVYVTGFGGLGSSDIGTKVTYTLTEANTWYRVKAIHEFANIDIAVEFHIIEKNADSDIIYYCDGWQIERTKWSDYITSWFDGNRNGDGHLSHDSGLVTGWSDITINFWMKGDSGTPTGSQYEYLFALTDKPSENAAIRIYRPGSSDNLVYYHKVNGLLQAVGSASGCFDGAWHMITCTLRRNPETGEYKQQLYKDGTLSGSQNYDPCDFSLFEEFIIGALDDTSNIRSFNGVMDEVKVLPFAANQAWVTAVYGLTQAYPQLPFNLATGDFIPENSVLVAGKVIGEKIAPINDGVVWRNNARIIEFELYEA